MKSTFTEIAMTLIMLACWAGACAAAWQASADRSAPAAQTHATPSQASAASAPGAMEEAALVLRKADASRVTPI